MQFRLWSCSINSEVDVEGKRWGEAKENILLWCFAASGKGKHSSLRRVRLVLSFKHLIWRNFSVAGYNHCHLEKKGNTVFVIDYMINLELSSRVWAHWQFFILMQPLFLPSVIKLYRRYGKAIVSAV